MSPLPHPPSVSLSIPRQCSWFALLNKGYNLSVLANKHRLLPLLLPYCVTKSSNSYGLTHPGRVTQLLRVHAGLCVIVCARTPSSWATASWPATMLCLQFLMTDTFSVSTPFSALDWPEATGGWSFKTDNYKSWAKLKISLKPYSWGNWNWSLKNTHPAWKISALKWPPLAVCGAVTGSLPQAGSTETWSRLSGSSRSAPGHPQTWSTVETNFFVKQISFWSLLYFLY